MGLTEFALSQAMKMAVDHVDRSGIILKTASEIDKLADERLGATGSEAFQSKVVNQLLLPLCRELMKENPFAYQKALTDERSLVSANLGGGQLISGELGQIPGKERPSVPTQNFVPQVRSSSHHSV